MRISDWSSDVCSSDLDSLLALERPVLDSWTVSGGFSFAYEIIDETADTGEGERSFQLFGLPMTASRDTTDDPPDPHEGSRLLFSLTPATGFGSANLPFLTEIVRASCRATCVSTCNSRG